MKSIFIKLNLVGMILLGLFMLFGPVKTAMAEMSPRDGYLRTTTGAPLPGITIVEYSDWCPPQGQISQMMPGCPYPTNCHSERSTVTDANGRYYFAPGIQPYSSSDPCNMNVWWRYTCSNPHVLYKVVATPAQQAKGFELIPNAQAESGPAACPPVEHPTSNVPQSITTDLTCNIKTACNKACTTPADCDGAHDGCTECVPNDNGQGSTCKPPTACGTTCVRDDQCAGGAAKAGCNTCVPNNEGTGSVCAPAPACNSTCVRDDQCVGDAAKNGCNLCLPKADGSGRACQAPACNVGCERDDQCAGAKDGCTVCLPNDAGTGKACRPVPGCGVACTRTGQCEGAKDGCTECVEQTDGSGICEEPFSNDMCKCDGFEAINLKYPTDKNFTFEAYAKVEGKDIKRAGVQSIQIKLYKSSKTNPNVATVVAKSAVLTPQVVETTTSKVRYKVSWSVAPPAMDKNAVFRVGADIKCAPKLKKKADASFIDESKFIPGGATYDSDSSKVMASYEGPDGFSYSPFVLSAQSGEQIPVGDDDGLQLGTLKFIRMVDTDACSFIRFEFIDP